MKNFYKYLSYVFIIISIVLLIGIISESTARDSKEDSSLDISITDEIQEEVDSQERELVRVLMQTTQGNITLELDKTNAPITVENFISYVEDDFYSGTVFHRVIDGFMIQGGGFTEDQVQKETKNPIMLESYNGLSNTRGTIAMARTNVPNSATSQFFINVVDNTFLDFQSASQPGYAVFGKVTQGMEVVDQIRLAQTTTKGPHQNWPVEDIVIISVTILE
ncbi:MAG: peptidylprolyl isomerase [Nanoarchaeota archaeon]|nr:peptidylprolyl isomerase [Nanoarchaeota archaeon]